MFRDFFPLQKGLLSLILNHYHSGTYIQGKNILMDLHKRCLSHNVKQTDSENRKLCYVFKQIENKANRTVNNWLLMSLKSQACVIKYSIIMLVCLTTNAQRN